MGSIRHILSLRQALLRGKTKYICAYASSIANVRYSLLRGRLLTETFSAAGNRFILKNSCSTSSKKPDAKIPQAVTEDDDVQNILKEFAEDFAVNEERKNAEVLEDLSQTGIGGKENLDKSERVEPSQSVQSYRASLEAKYKEFQDSDSSIVYSMEEEMHRKVEEEDDYFFHIDDEQPEVPVRELKRGVTGVFDIHELVDVLREERGCDIVVINIPKEYHYTDYMVLVNAKSLRHATAMGELIIKLYKRKKAEFDPFVKMEGDRYASWRAVDMGNIVLHILLEDIRAMYDIEPLWLLDVIYDSGGHQKDEDNVMDSLEEQIAFMENLKLN